MLLLIRPKKQIYVRRRKPIVSATKKIGALASQIFTGLIGLAISMGLLLKGGNSLHQHTTKHKELIAILHNVTAVFDGLLILSAVLAFLFVRNRDEH